jgi:hypothetical protein
MTKSNLPIALTGNVFVNEHLARRFPEYKAPQSFSQGDVIIHSHLDERGRKNLQLKNATRRPTRKTRYLTLSGYFTALIFDGQSWRAFRIGDLVGGDGWYTSQRFKELKIHGVVFILEKLKGRTASWGDDHAYEVGVGASAAAVVSPEPGVAVSDPAASDPIASDPIASDQVTSAAVATGNQMAAAAAARANQLELF